VNHDLQVFSALDLVLHGTYSDPDQKTLIVLSETLAATNRGKDAFAIMFGEGFVKDGAPDSKHNINNSPKLT
jgi:hypothetical protein